MTFARLCYRFSCWRLRRKITKAINVVESAYNDTPCTAELGAIATELRAIRSTFQNGY